MGIGLYNGQWSYFPVPTFEYIKAEDLNSLSLPFHITLENGKVINAKCNGFLVKPMLTKTSFLQFKTISMNDQEPEWASNIKRGLATYLQMNMERVTPQQLMFFKDEEVKTTNNRVESWNSKSSKLTSCFA